MEVVLAIIAGLFSICVAIFGAVFVNINNTKMQTRKEIVYYKKYKDSIPVVLLKL